MASFYEEGSELIVNYIAWETDLMVFQYSSPRAARLDVSYVSYESYTSRRSINTELLDALCEGNTCRFEIDIATFDPAVIM